MRRWIPVACLALIVVGWAFSPAAQEPPANLPKNQLPTDKLPPDVDSRAFGVPPDLPLSKLDESKLTEEEKKVVDRIRSNILPPDATFSDLLEKWLEPRPYPKATVIREGEKYAYSHPAVALKMEFVREDGDTVWLRGIPPEDPESPLHQLWRYHEDMEILYKERKELVKNEYFLDFGQEIVPQPFVDGLQFEEKKSQLPTRGRWQMNFVLADMNEDGIDDLVFPPERKGTAYPSIFLGDGTGAYSFWREARWPRNVTYDYGGIDIADYDGDGHLDVAIAVHFKAQFVMYGDGHGIFARSVRLPSPDPRLTARAVTSADFDRDGRIDLAFVAEINYDQATSARIHESPTVWITLNRGGQRWELFTEGLPKGRLISDYLLAQDLDGDERPDLVLGSNTSGWRSLVYLNTRDGWKDTSTQGVLSRAYHFEIVPGGPQRVGRNVDLYAAFAQFQLWEGHNEARTGIIRYPFGSRELDVVGRPIFFDDARTNVYYRLAVGDLDGDGREDVVVGRKNGEIEVYLQVAADHFYLEKSPELVAPGRTFGIQLADVNGDGLDDIIAAFVMDEKRPGGVRVWLSHPVAE